LVRLLAIVGLLVSAPSVAAAQGPYLGASLEANMVRGSDSFEDRDGTTPAVGVRVGTTLGERWGLDLEAEYAGEIKGTPETVFPLSSTGALSFPTGVSLFTDLSLPSRFERRTRFSTLSTHAWIRQRPFSRVDLVYLGGVALVRTQETSRIGSYQLPGAVFPGAPSVIIPGYESTSTWYDAAPSLGLDAPVHVTAHLRIVPGVRLLAFRNLLLARPSIGAHWQF